MNGAAPLQAVKLKVPPLMAFNVAWLLPPPRRNRSRGAVLAVRVAGVQYQAVVAGP